VDVVRVRRFTRGDDPRHDALAGVGGDAHAAVTELPIAIEIQTDAHQEVPLHLAHLRGVGPTRVPKRAFPFDGSEVVLPFMNGPDPRTRARPRSGSAGPGARCTAATIAAAGAIAAVSAGAVAPVAPR